MKKSKKLHVDIEEKTRQYDQEGRVVVCMNVKDDTNFLSLFSASDTPVISSDVAEFIETNIHDVNLDEQLTLCIKSNCIDGTEQQIYRRAIKTYYSEKFCANQRELKIQNKIALILAILGIFVLSISIFWDVFIGNRILAEVVDIVAWVLLWEAVDTKFFKTRSIALQQKRYVMLICMKIQYENF